MSPPQVSPPMGTVRQSANGILVVGTWLAVRPHPDPLPVEQASAAVGKMSIGFADPKIRHVEQAVAAQRPSWLLLADGLDEEAITVLVGAGRAVGVHLRVAMLGPVGDVDRCLRWTRRFCSVYLVNTASVKRVVRCVRLSSSGGLVVIDESFFEAARSKRVDLVAPLTPRERDVLRLLRHGLRNAEIAGELHVAESTIEFHVRHLLEKFAARNRTEVIERAIRSGL